MPTRKTEQRIYVRAARTFVGNDGDTAVVVLAGTSGFITSEGVTKAPYAASRRGDVVVDADPDEYAVEVCWDAAVLNKEEGLSVVSRDWVLHECPIRDLAFVDRKTVYADDETPAEPSPEIAIRSLGGVTTLVVALDRLEEILINESGKIHEADVPGLLANVCGQALAAGGGDAALAETYRDLYAKQAYCDDCGCAPCKCENDTNS